MRTIHEKAIWLYRLYCDGKKTWRRRHMPRAVRDAIAAVGRESTAHLHRDFRPGIGSGRAAHWCQRSFEVYAVACRTIHRELGFRDAECRRIARVLQLHGDQMLAPSRLKELAALPPCPIDPMPWGAYNEEHCRMMAAGIPDNGDARRWYLYQRWHIGRAISEFDARERLAACERNPGYRISGYLAESILAWQAGAPLSGSAGGHHCYAGCSGSESYVWHRDHPEQWDMLLSHAPVGAKGDGWEQVYPHERDRQADLEARGWFHTLRFSDSLYTAGHPMGATP